MVHNAFTKLDLNDLHSIVFFPISLCLMPQWLRNVFNILIYNEKCRHLLFIDANIFSLCM